ncbi:hypothetical protein NBRC116596_04650 [Litorivita sp. NS0012-18]
MTDCPAQGPSLTRADPAARARRHRQTGQTLVIIDPPAAFRYICAVGRKMWITTGPKGPDPKIDVRAKLCP